MAKLTDDDVASLFGADEPEPEQPVRVSPHPRTVQPVSKTLQRLHRLACFDEIDRRVKALHPLADIARYVQEQGEMTGMTERSLVRLLTKHRDAVPPTEIVPLEAGASRSAGSMRAKKERALSRGLDELGEMAKLYELGKVRVQRGSRHERQFAYYSRYVGADLERLVKLLSTSAQLKMDLGIDIRNIGTLDVSNTGGLDPETALKGRVGAKLLEVFASPEKRRRLLDTGRVLNEMEDRVGPEKLREMLTRLRTAAVDI